MRHKWSSTMRSGAVSCLMCDCIREYVRGKVTYFLNDSVTEKAPKCDPNNFKPLGNR